jgi:eukaryotic-like serine/threonine-protein kinase
MEPSAWARAKSLLADAADLPAGDRERFVIEHCDDPLMQRDVLDLLASPAPLTNIVAAGALEPGFQLGSYVVEERLGRGGMGEVYAARDTALNRRVAVKVLPPALAGDLDRVARLRREAQFLAALNHPNVAQVHGVVDSGDAPALVMELVDGPTLADRLAREVLPLEQVIDIARQLVAALAAAHERGIVHRDLKPSNIKIRHDGVVKVLDFGLAKAFDAPYASSSGSREHVADVRPTQSGAVLGTIAYMAPEQAVGKRVDKRADIWAFGCVLYEMLTGRPAFPGPVGSDDRTRVLHQPSESGALPGRTPESIRRLLTRCLQRDPERRLADIGDARFDLDEASIRADPIRGDAWGHRSGVIAGVALATVAAVAAATIAARMRPGPSGTEPRARGSFVIQLPADALVAGLDAPAVAISPDGTRLVYVGGGPARRLYVRRIDDPEVTPIAGTDGASSPFFSPDGRSIGFFANASLARVSVDGGSPTVVCACGATNPRGAAWGADGTIAFVPYPAAAVMTVNVNDGVDRPLTSLDLKRGEGGHRWPEFVPGADAIAFVTGTAAAQTWDDGDIVVQSLLTGERRTLIQGTQPRFAPPGHLLYVRHGVLMAAPFDAKRLMISATPAPVLNGVMQSTFGAAQFSVSQTGLLLHVPGAVGQRELTWVTRSGALQPIATPPRTYWNAHLSPDGTRLVTSVEGPGYDVWTYDVNAGGDALDRATSGGTHAWPIWSPDGSRVTFNAANEKGVLNLFWKAADGSGPEEQLTSSDRVQVPDSWSPDGRYLAYTESDHAGHFHIGILARDRSDPAPPVQYSEFIQGGPMFSPDGRWLAYASNESGQFEVYVRPFPGPGARQRVSAGGGTAPLWAKSGRELFYRSGRRLLAVDVALGPSFRHGAPRMLFEGPFLAAGQHANYDVNRGGDRFIMIVDRTVDTRPAQIGVTLNWRDKERPTATGSAR